MLRIANNYVKSPNKGLAFAQKRGETYLRRQKTFAKETQYPFPYQ